MDARLAPVIGVIGSTGGVGASTFACALAAASGRGLLVDLDTYGAGLDVLLGIEQQPGARWSGLRVGGGSLDPIDLARGLPRWRGVPLIAADGARPTPAAVSAVLAAGRTLGPVVMDLGRCTCTCVTAAVAECALVVLLTEADSRGLAAARAMARLLTAVPVGLVIRRGCIPAAEAAAVTGLTVLGELGPIGLRRGAHRMPRSMVRVAAGVLDGVRDEVPYGIAG